MLRYAHTISSSSRRLASRHPMFCDSCTAGPRQFYPLRNSDLTISDAKMAVERNSKGVYLMLRNKITNNRLSLLLDEGTKKLVLDSEISGEWTGADPIVTKSDLALLSFTWTGEATNYIDTSITIDGYKPIAITGLNPTGLGTTEALRYFRFNKNNLRAIASFTAKTVTSCIFDVLCIRI